MAPKQLKLTELFAIPAGLAVKNSKRKLSDCSSSGLSTCPPKKKSVLATINNNNIIEGEGVDQEDGVIGKDLQGMQREIASSGSLPALFSTLSEPGWSALLDTEFRKDYMTRVWRFLEEQDGKGVTVFPPRHLIFNAFNLTPFDQIRVIILGQDPYHNLRQAHGLCFSVPNGESMPPSLKNIFKELSAEFSDFKIPQHGTLTNWATQGVFLLNATLTVEAHKANSHSKIGWQQFTDAVIKLISDRSERGAVFLLWGGFAHKKEALIDPRKHRIIKTAHPSPLSARFFLGCKCFSRTNAALAELGHSPINWTAL